LASQGAKKKGCLAPTGNYVAELPRIGLPGGAPDFTHKLEENWQHHDRLGMETGGHDNINCWGDQNQQGILKRPPDKAGTQKKGEVVPN